MWKYLFHRQKTVFTPVPGQELIMKQYFSERNEDSFDDVIAFADTNTRSIQDITERLNNAYTDSVSIPNKETTFDLSSRGTIKNIINQKITF